MRLAKGRREDFGGLSLVGFSEKLSERGILGGAGEDPSCPSGLWRDEGWRDEGMCSLV